MEKPTSIAAPKGKLGVLLPGMGAVATTFMAGVELVRTKKAQPVGSLTQMGTIRLGKRTEGRSPRIKDFIKLAKLEDIVFGGWDIFPDSSYEAAAKAGVLDPHHLAMVKTFLSKIKPMPAAFDRQFVKMLDGKHVKKGKTKYEIAVQLKKDIADFKKKHKCARMVMLWCGSTEVFLTQDDVHSTPEKFEKAMKENHPAIAPSMLYAWAAITSGIAYGNGAPNLSVDIPALQTLALQHNVPIGGKDFKTGQTLIKTVLAPAFKARMLGLNGWFSTNILGNRDGEVLEDPGSFKTKEESKLGALEFILQPHLYPELTRRFTTRCASTTTRRAGTTRKAGTTLISSVGSATRCRLRWISSVATPSLPRPSFSTSCCSWTWRSAPECAAFRNGSAFTSSRP